MTPQELNTGLMVKTVLAALAHVESLSPKQVLLQNPDVRARLPCVVVGEVLARQRYGGFGYDLSIKVEAWAEGYYEAALLADRVRIALGELCWRPASPLPQQVDEITRAVRFGNYYECRWNAVENTFEQNR